MTLAAVRSFGATRQLASVEELEDFEPELVDRRALAAGGIRLVCDLLGFSVGGAERCAHTSDQSTDLPIG